MAAKRGLSRGKAMNDDDDFGSAAGQMPSLSLSKGLGMKEDGGNKRGLVITPVNLGDRSSGLGGGNAGFGGQNNLMPPQQQRGFDNPTAQFGNSGYNQQPYNNNNPNNYGGGGSPNTHQQQQPYGMGNSNSGNFNNNYNQGSQQPLSGGGAFGSNYNQPLGGSGGFNNNNLNPPNMGGGAMGMGGMNNSPQFGNNNIMNNMGSGGSDIVLNSMVQQIQGSFQQRRIGSIVEFFAPYDVYEGRQIEAWELEMMFMNNFNQDDARRFIDQHGTNLGMGNRVITFQQLLSLIQMKVQMPPGTIQRASIYQAKPKPPLIQGYLNQILRALTQSGRPLDMAFDQYFPQKQVNQNDLQHFQQNIGVIAQPNDAYQLFNYFLIQNENVISKICFIQALKQQQNPNGSANISQYDTIQHQNRNNIPHGYEGRVSPQLTTFVTATSFDSIQTSQFGSNEHPLMQRVIQAARNHMLNNRNQSFEGMLNQFNIQPLRDIDYSKFEELCLRLSLTFSLPEMNTLTSILDPHKRGAVQTQILRQKIEQNQSQNITPMQSNITSGQGMYPPPTINMGNLNQQPYNQNVAGGAAYNNNINNNLSQSFGHNNRPPTLSLDNPVSFGPVTNQGFNNHPGGDIKPVLDKVRQYLQSLGYLNNIFRLFNVSWLNGKEVAELQEFLNFLQSPGLNISQNQAYQIAQDCQMLMTSRKNYQTTIYVDLEKFEQLLSQGNQQQMGHYQHHRDSMQTMSRIYDSIRKYIMVTGGNIQKFFIEADVNKDNFISKAELKLALEKIGHHGITDQEINQIYLSFDQNQDGRISYAELCQQFAEFSNTKAIKDPSHWSFWIFENIRRACHSTQRPIADLFGLQGLNIQNLQQKYYISKEQFFRGLSGLQINLYLDQEQKLLELLDADAAHQNQIDFIHFCGLVGLHYQPAQIQQINNDYSRNPMAQLTRDKMKRFYKTLVGVLESRRTSIPNLQMMLRGHDLGNMGVISFDEFIKVLNELDYERKIDFDNAKEVLQKYLVQGGGFNQQINYKDFLRNLVYQNEKYQVINLIFLTLQNEMNRLNKTNLYDVFKAYDRSNGLRQFDKDMLVQTLRAIGVQLNDIDIGMLIIEYDPDGRDGRLDFAQFESDFKKYQQGQSELNYYVKRPNVQYNDFNNYIGSNKPGLMYPQPAVIGNNQSRVPNGLVIRLQEKVAKYFDSEMSYSIHQALLKRGITKLGILKEHEFLDWLQRDMYFNRDDALNLYNHYDPMSRGEMKISEFLIDLKDKIINISVRLGVTELAQQFSFQVNTTPQGAGFNKGSNLQRFQKDFEEIFKAIKIRGMDTFGYFQSVARGSDRINQDLFRQALFSLELKYLKQNDIDSIFEQLDTTHQQVIQIYTIDEAIRKNCNLNEQQMYDDVMEKIVKAFNGDDGFLLTQLMEYDRSRRGLVDIMSFTEFIVKNSPHHQQLSEIDVKFLGNKYTNPRSTTPNVIDINTFLSDFSRLRQLRGLQRGDYSGLHNIQQRTYGDGAYNTNYDNFGSGHRNPYLPQTSKTNTKAELNRTRPPPHFRINLESKYLEDIAKGTYLQDKLVENYFQTFGQVNNNGILSEADFASAIQRLNLSWVANSTNQVYSQIDLAFHQQSKRFITPEEIDQAVCFASKKNIDDLQLEILTQIAKYAAQRGLNLRQEIQNCDVSSSKQIRLDQLKHIILNEIRAPSVMDNDVDFISKKYIQNIPSVIPYERFLDDFEAITKSSFSNMGSSAQICEYIKKGVIINKTDIIDFFQKFMSKRNILTLQDIEKGCLALGLVPTICEHKQIENLFYDIENSGVQEMPLQKFIDYVIKVANKQTREMQDNILDEICTRAQGKNIMVENLFKKDDQMNKGYVADHVFYTILGRQLQVKDIDSKLLGMRYEERADYINYTQFLQDVKLRKSNAKHLLPDNSSSFGGNTYGNTSGVQVGLNSNNATGNNYQQNRLKELLIQVSQYVQQTGISLTTQLSQLERGQATGTVPYNQFLQTLSANLRLASNDVTFLADIYAIQSPGAQQFNQQVDYRKFLADLKMQQLNTPNKYQSALTNEQIEFYKKLGNHMKSKNKVNIVFESFLERDISHKFYLPRITIQEVLKKNEYKFSNEQLNTFFGPVEKNSHGEYSYKNIFEILLGEEDARKLVSGGLVGSGAVGRGMQQTHNFYMPQQPIGAANPQLDSIGRKMIQSNINYEEEIRKRIGAQQSNSQQPKASEQEILDVIKACNVFLSPDERTALVAYFQSKQDYAFLIPVLDFLQALGLPAQTLGTRGQKQLPRKILNPQELKAAQDIINRIRHEISMQNKHPKDVFEMFKTNQSDLTMSIMKFKLALGTVGQIGRTLNDEQINLLVYYLAQEVPDEVSFRKMYLAFTLTDKDQPLKQEGAEEIQQYQKKLTERLDKGLPIEILDLQHFMRENQLTLPQILKNNMPKDLMPRQEFETALKEAGYVAGDMQKLIQLLDVRGNLQSVSIQKLQAYLQRAAPALANRSITKQEARDRYQGFDPKVRHYLQKISEYMKRMNISITKMYDSMDLDRSGTVEKQEFVTKLTYLDIPGVQMQDIGMIFDAIDINNDGKLSANEFSMFLEGANVTRQQRSQEIDPKIIEEMKQQIEQLFHQFDDNGDGYVTPEEIQKAMIGLGQRISLDDAKLMIASIDSNGDGRLDKREFTDLMLPKMKEELLSSEESVEDLRAMFIDADIDHSGTLSIDEIYSVILKLGAKVEQNELIELMNEIDVDRDGTVDIDEFMALMSLGDEMQFRSAQAKSTFMNIKKARKLSAMDFFKSFKNLPQSFVPSFFTEKWSKSKKNLPSSVFMPQIDKTTMLYKDLYPILKENLTENMNQLAFQPRVRPLYTQLGCQITLDGAQGVPLPASGNGFDSKTQIVKRMVRIGIFDTIKKDFIYNAVQVNALYNQVDEDIWAFNAWKDNGTNPVLFKSANKDEVLKPNIFMIFELVIAVKSGEKVTEISCGWCQIEMDKLDRVMTHKLPIKGGSPNAEMLIKDQDVHTNRTGMKYIMKVMQSKIQSQLTVSVRPFNKFTEESKLHMNLLPSCCLIQKRLLYFVSGFRNYLGEKLLRESAMSYFRQPEGDVIISCFPKILDNPDICEQIIHIWSENVWSGLNERAKQNIELIMLRTKEFIQKLYPVIYAEEFHFNMTDYTMSAAGDQYLLRKREELIKSALCFGNPQSKIKVDKPLEAMTTFKPFTVRELEFEVWDTKAANIDRYMRQYEELGLLQGGSQIHNHNNNNNPYQQNQLQNPQQQLGLNQVPSVINRINQNQRAAVLGQSQQPLQLNNNIQINKDLAGGYRNPNMDYQQQQQQQQFGSASLPLNNYGDNQQQLQYGQFNNNNNSNSLNINTGPLTLEQRMNRQFQQ